MHNQHSPTHQSPAPAADRAHDDAGSCQPMETNKRSSDQVHLDRAPESWITKSHISA
jgi:hypothetical protein